MKQVLARWWKADPVRSWLFVGGFLYALFFAQGIPLWDDDFTSWFWKIKDQSLFHYIFEWVSPISTQPQFWGFNERPLQSIVYKLCYLISGYESWSYFLFKSLVYGGLGVMIYSWAMRLVPKTVSGQRAALAASLFFLLAPNPMAAHILHQDLAPLAELLFLGITYVLWDGIEKTPMEWKGMPDFRDPEQKKWMLRWAGLAGVTYLAYKSKADLKLVPVVLSLYVALLRRHQWKFFAIPVGLMCLLAVPWGPGIFSKLPPFIPGSGGSQIGWMWQPASFDRFREFLWSSAPFDFLGSLRSPTVSLAGLLGPFLLVGMLAFLVWRAEAFDKVPWTRHESREDRARIFVLVWFGVILLGTSALPAINYTFRIRYGILPMVPTSILLSWVFSLFVTTIENGAGERNLPRWAAVTGFALLAIQASINLNRSIAYRRDMGQVMVAVDQAYDYVNKNFPTEKLVLMPDFRPYDYRPDAAPTFATKEWISNTDELPKRFAPGKTYAVSWKPSLWPDVEMVKFFPGCRSASLFDRIFPCPSGTGTYLMRFIGEDPLYVKGEALRNKGDIVGARKLHEQFLAKHPDSMAGQFVVGLEAFQQKDWPAAERAYGNLEKYFPDHLSILYNHALALAELNQYQPAIDRLKYLVTREPANYAGEINLYWAYKKAQKERQARKVLAEMKKLFPNDQQVRQLGS